MSQLSQWIRIAHRGASGLAPENTLAAFSKALEIGVDGVELDVHGTADGEVVVIHDSALDRTTDRTGQTRALTFAQIQQADAGVRFGSEFAGERIPKLAEALDLMKGQAITVIEIKDRGIVPAVASTIQQTDTVAEVIVISFHPEVLQEMRALSPKVPTGFLIGHSEESTARGQAVDLVQRTCEYSASTLDIQHQAITPEFAYEVRRRGVALWCWTVDDVAQMRELVACGVQGITSNYPDRFQAVIDSTGTDS